jgi:hypothetical protein
MAFVNVPMLFHKLILNSLRVGALNPLEVFICIHGLHARRKTLPTTHLSRT